MNKLFALVVATAVCAGTGAAVVGSRADAQDAPRPGMTGQFRPGMGGPGMGERGMGGGEREGMRRPGMMMRRMRAFSLIYPAADRNLSGPDVQKIAEAFLLFNGNHTWKVTEVTEQPDEVSFALATPDGTAIAHFTMDRHTGRPERVN